MQTFTHLRLGRWVGAIVAALLAIPAGLSTSPAAAVPTGTPGPIPQIRVASVGAHSVTLEWDAPFTPGDSAVIDYAIEYRYAGGLWYTATDGVSTERAATVTGLTTGREYEFRVAAVNGYGAGPATALGTLDRLESKSGEPCGLRSDGTWTCFYLGVRTARFPVGDYNFPSTYDYVTDVSTFGGGCFLSESRGVVCSTDWNRYGELGRGFIGGPGGSFPVPGLPDDVVSVSSSGNTNCALTASGDLWCWGQWDWSVNARHLMTPTKQQSDIASFDGQCAIASDGSATCIANSGGPYRWVSIPGLPAMSIERSNAVRGSCGISVAKTVICIDPNARTWTEIAGISGAVDVTVSWLVSCALLETGSVTCWGNNDRGQLGDGTRLTGKSTVMLPEPVVALVTNDQLDTATGWSCATGVSATIYCWGPYTGQLATSTPSPLYRPYAVAGIGAETVEPLRAPTQVTGVAQSARTTQTVSVSWDAVINDRAPTDSYLVEWREGTNAWSSETVSAPTTHWTSPSLGINRAIDVRVSAVNAAGVGPASSIAIASTTTPPQRPSHVTLTSNTNDSVTVEWNRAPDEDEPITGYQLEWTTDRDVWHMIDVPANVTQYTFSGLGIAAAIDVRIRSKNAAGISAVSSTNTFYTSGLGPRSFLVTDSWGQPAFGGRVTWKSPSGAFQSALDYGLTVDGLVTFPYMPAGELDVTLSEVQLPSGALANYSQKTIVGYVRPSTILIPAEPSRPTHTVTVKLPNGLPVVGAHVTVTNLYDYAKKGNAEFFTPPIVNEGVTNEFGEVYLTGYSTVGSQVDIEYNDGVLIQRLTGLLGTEDRTFTLEEMPWLVTPVVTEETRAGSLVTVTVTATGLGATRAGTTANAAKVTVVPPKGATQNCAGKSLSGAFGADGTATLKVCATKSGRYLLKGVGVVSTGAIDLKVKGAAPLPVTRARAFSPSHRAVTVAWDAPTYTGGVDVSKYTVTLSTRSKTITKTVKSTSVDFTGLNGTQRYTVTIVATTGAGSSEPVRLLVPVS